METMDITPQVEFSGEREYVFEIDGKFTASEADEAAIEETLEETAVVHSADVTTTEVGDSIHGEFHVDAAYPVLSGLSGALVTVAVENVLNDIEGIQAAEVEVWDHVNIRERTTDIAFSVTFEQRRYYEEEDNLGETKVEELGDDEE